MSHWIYNGVGSPAWPDDLGYWVGYRIAQAFYLRAPDEKLALRELLLMKDPQDILNRSGFVAGVQP